MKKSVLFLFVLMTSIVVSEAQHMDVRLFGGFNVTQLTSDEGETIIDGVTHFRSVQGRPGVEFGAAMTFGDRFYIQPGFKYSSLSSEVVQKNSQDNTQKFSDITTVQVISVPLKVGVRFIDPETEDVFNVRVFAGFDGHHVVNVTHSSRGGNEDVEEDDFTNLIVNADFGMGVDVLFLFADLGYQLGLSPIYTVGENRATANTFYSNIGLRIKF
jgi:hypothetical protein